MRYFPEKARIGYINSSNQTKNTHKYDDRGRYFSTNNSRSVDSI